MEGAGGSGGSSTCLMGFGDGVGLSPLMIMPLMASATSPPKHVQHGAHSNETTNLLHFSSSNTTTTTAANADLLAVPFGHEVGAGDNDHNIKAKIMTHPHYPRLLSAYANCHKIGAPPDVVAKLEEACASSAVAGASSVAVHHGSCLGEDPALDQFMEAYCEMLTKYEEELSKPFKEAMLFLSRVESQFKSLTLTSPSPSSFPPNKQDVVEKNASSEDDVADADDSYIDPQAEDRELKGQLLRRYSGYLGSLKKEFLKKRKKGKLPKEARQQLLDWWSRHYKWPYPSESQKLALAESTGLDQKQINNWFINQRKRHWKPSEEMQFVVMDTAHPTHYYLDNGFGGGNPFSVDCGPNIF